MRRTLGYLLLALTAACGAAADDDTAQQAADASASADGGSASDAGDADLGAIDAADNHVADVSAEDHAAESDSAPDISVETDASADVVDAAFDDGAIEDAPLEPYTFADAWPTACAGGSTSSSAPSCASGCPGAGDNCGPSGTDDCCKSPLVPGGTFNRFNDPAYPATVSDFRLDKYEVTVGRFRAFLASGHGTQANPPPPGSGAHPKHPETGWDPAWNAKLPVDLAELASPTGLTYHDTEFPKTGPTYTWTDLPAGNEKRAINDINWYLAFAFCVWDGGRLPTEPEWVYAAMGGDEERPMPWGSAQLTQSHASFRMVWTFCNGNLVDDCVASDVIEVGTRPLGDGRWGQSDLFGNVYEWGLDVWGAILVPCIDCVSTTPPPNADAWGGPERLLYGNSFVTLWPALGTTINTRWAAPPVGHRQHDEFGMRCARDL